MPPLARSIYERFSEVAKERSAETAVFFKKADEWKGLSFGEIRSQSISLGNLLHSYGIKSSDKVAIMMGNQPEWPISFMAIQYIGCVAVPIDINLSPEEIKKQVGYSGVRAVLSTENAHIHLPGVLPGPKIILTDSPEVRNAIKAFPPVENKEILKETAALTMDDMSAMFYTSGTTDTPKAVMLTHKNLLSNLRSFKKLDLIKSDYVFISFLPLHHTYSFMVTCLVPLLEGGHISYPSILTPEEIINCIKATNVNVLVGVPRFFDILHRNIKSRLKKVPLLIRLALTVLQNICWVVRRYFKINLNRYLFSRLHKNLGSSLDYMLSGGARLEPDVIHDLFKWGFTVLEGYGLTETSPVVTFNTPEYFRIGSAGRAIPEVEIKIINPDKAGMGEIAVRGPNVMAGYYRRPEDTGSVMRDGWFFSGDLGYIDKDGYLYIKGRKDEILVLGSGKKVNPEEIESHYASNPYIKEVCVVISKPGMLTAVIVPDEKYFHQRAEANFEEKIRQAVDNLSHSLISYKRIHGFVISRDPLPRTAMGKLMRHKISYERERAQPFSMDRQERLSEEDRALLSSETCKKMLKFISNYVKKNRVNLDDNLELDLGLDSLGRIELLMEIGQFLNIELSESQAKEFLYTDTVRELMLKAKAFLPKET